VVACLYEEECVGGEMPPTCNPMLRNKYVASLQVFGHDGCIVTTSMLGSLVLGHMLGTNVTSSSKHNNANVSV
jgi:hypothetical protein